MWRVYRRSPAFALTVVATLACGIGAVSGAWSAVDGLLLRSLPYPDSERIVAIEEVRADGQPAGVAMRNMLDWRERTRGYEAMALLQPRSFGLTAQERGSVHVAMTGMVTAEFFAAMGVAPKAGRVFADEETAIVLAAPLWRRLFAGASDAVGRKIWLNEQPYTVVGVLPDEFESPAALDLEAYIPLSRRDYCCGRTGSQTAFARIRADVRFEAAKAELDAVARAVAAPFPEIAGRSARIVPLEEKLRGSRRQALWMLLAACALLAGITAANATGLLLARLLERASEFAVRMSLGAGASGMARQFLGEALGMVVPAVIAGLWLGAAFLQWLPTLLAWGGMQLPAWQWKHVTLGASTMLFTAAVALGLVALLTLVPTALVRRTDWRGVLNGSMSAAAWWRSAAVAAQVALSVVLLASAGLLLRSFHNAAGETPGFDASRVYTFGIGIPEARYDTEPKMIRFHREVLARFAVLPAVESAAFMARLPVRPGTAGAGFQKEGELLPPDERPRAAMNLVTPEYLTALRVPLLAGRMFSWRDDRPDSPRAVVINDAFRRTYFAGEDPLGKRLILPWRSELHPAGAPWEIAGVIGDTRNAGLDQPAQPEIFLSLTQVGLDGGTYAVRARAESAALARDLRAARDSVDPNLQELTMRPIEERLAASIEPRKLAQWLVTLCGAIALAVTLLGIAALVSFEVSQRRREIAIRMALGAGRLQLAFGMAGRMTAVVAGGLAAGGVLFALTGPWMRAHLYGVTLGDPITHAAVAGLVLIAALTASLIPGWRAARMEPMRVLRES